MLRTKSPVRSLVLALTVASSLAACGSDSPTAPSPIAGSYKATVFQVTPTGQPTIDILAQGGSLSIVIAPDNSTTGTLSIPGSATGGAPFTESMAGTAIVTGNTVHFTGAADTFVPDLAWTVNGSTLEVVNQAAGTASFTITLSR